MATDKELIELADKGLLSKATRVKAIKAYYRDLLPKMHTIKDAVITTAIKFELSENTIRTIVNK
jgi:hypothetical protein